MTVIDYQQAALEDGTTYLSSPEKNNIL